MFSAFCQGVVRERVKRRALISDVSGSVSLPLTVVLYKECVGKNYVSVDVMLGGHNS